MPPTETWQLLGADGEIAGPFTTDQLKAQLASGELSPIAQARRGPDGEWQAVAVYAELAATARRHMRGARYNQTTLLSVAGLAFVCGGIGGAALVNATSDDAGARSRELGEAATALVSVAAPPPPRPSSTSLEGARERLGHDE